MDLVDYLGAARAFLRPVLSSRLLRRMWLVIAWPWPRWVKIWIWSVPDLFPSLKN